MTWQHGNDAMLLDDPNASSRTREPRTWPIAGFGCAAPVRAAPTVRRKLGRPRWSSAVTATVIHSLSVTMRQWRRVSLAIKHARSEIPMSPPGCYVRPSRSRSPEDSIAPSLLCPERCRSIRARADCSDCEIGPWVFGRATFDDMMIVHARLPTTTTTTRTITTHTHRPRPEPATGAGCRQKKEPRRGRVMG